jgi:two-component system phosphate regulon sensor histidine kinase PhoR
MRKRRLFWQLYPSYLVITLASLLAVTLYASGALRRFHLEQTKLDLRCRARLIEDEVKLRLTAGQMDAVDALCKELGARSSTRITVILPSGEVVGDSEEWPANMDNHSDRAEIIGAMAGRTGSSQRFSYTLGQEMAYVAIPVEHNDTILGVVRTSLPLTSINRALTAIYWRIALAGVVVALLAAGISVVISRRISRPLEQIKRGAERFAQGDLSHKLPDVDSQEIAALAVTMNQMAAQLDERIRTAVQERNEREAMLSSMVEGVLAVDCDQRVLSLNPACGRLFGVDARECQGRSLQEIARSPELHHLVTQVLSTGGSANDEIVFYGDEERVLRGQGTVLCAADGGAIGALIVLHDVTRIQRLENVRRDFVANVSHELKTPITSIKGYVETLLDGTVHSLDDVDRFLGIISAQANRLNAIIDDLLTLSQIEQEADRAEIALERVPVRDVLEAAIAASASRAEENRIRLDLSCADELEAQINAQLLEQAVTNLIDNACKYSPPGASVEVEAARVGPEVVIRVRDRGCGIERQHLDRIFERFYRVDKARSRKLGGTGLGLAIVKHIAQAHGGRATVESTPGQGSTFSICLPAP